MVKNEVIESAEVSLPEPENPENTIAAGATPRKPARHRKKSRKYRALEHKVGFLKVVLWSIGAVYAVAGFIAYGIFSIIQDENLKLNKDKRQQDAAMLQLRQQMDRIRSANEQLVMGRIPNLRPLKYGQVLSGVARFVTSIMFTITHSSGEKRYEYMAIVRNDMDSPVVPKVELYLFDTYGVQVGKALVTKSESPYQRRQELLKSGESRSYSAKLQINSKSKPEYFLIKTSSLSAASKE